MEILRYAEMFQGIRKQTMVEAQDTVARIVTQTDIFDELRHRRAVLEARKAELLTKYDQLLATEAETQFGIQENINTHKEIEKLKNKLSQLYAKRAENEAKLRDNADVKIQASVLTCIVPTLLQILVTHG